MSAEFINITKDNIFKEHLCCIIRSKTINLGVEAKRNWLNDRIDEGHIFRKVNSKDCGFIEFSPLDTAWVPITGNNYLYIYCLWVTGKLKGCGYGKKLMEYCLSQAKANGKSGVCMLGSEKQKAWLSSQTFAEKYGFKTVDSTNMGYKLLALSLDGTMPHFYESAKKEIIDSKKFTVYYDMQCPFIYDRITRLKNYCAEKNIEASFNFVDTLEKAKHLPSVFNNWCAFYNGKLVTVNLMDETKLKKILT